MGSQWKGVIGWVLVILLAAVLVSMYYSGAKKAPPLTYSEFLTSVEKGNVSKVTVFEEQKKIEGVFTDKKTFYVFIGDDPDLWKIMKQKGVKIDVKPPEQSSFWLNMIAYLGPFLLVGIFIFILYKQMQGAGNSAFSFVKSRAKLFSSNQPKATFNDVAGVEEAKEELKEVILFLKDPQRFTKLGGRIPKGVLLLGAPGTGKTLLARAVAGEAGVPFFSISGSDFVELFVGVGAARVRDLFEQGKKNAPCIIFIDELDAVGRKRGAGLGGGHDEREQTLNALLVEMDGFDSNTGVIIMSATNRPDVLDPALLRPGRFDRRIAVDAPDLKGREEILKIHTRKVPLSKSVNLNVIARGTPGFTGADLANLVNESALLAARRDKKEISGEELEEAKDKLIMGLERKSRIVGDKEKKITAYHEAGHALVGRLLPGAEPLHKVTIIPRGMALGVTARLPTEDRYMRTKGEYLNDITILLSGRVAEELFFDDITTGAHHDLEMVTHTAYRMVCEYGMSKVLGNRTFGRPDREVFIGGDYFREKDYSEETSKTIDREVRKIVDECYIKAKGIVEGNKGRLEIIAKALLEKEVLDGAEVDELLKDVFEDKKPKKTREVKKVKATEEGIPGAESAGGEVMETSKTSGQQTESGTVEKA